MIYKTILTSKGTTTVPVEIRKQLGVRPGMHIAFTKNKMGEFVITRSQTIDEVRDVNRRALQRAGTAHKKYKSGDGYAIFAKQKYGK